MAKLGEHAVMRHDPPAACLTFEKMFPFSIANFLTLYAICVNMWTPPFCERVNS